MFDWVVSLWSWSPLVAFCLFTVLVGLCSLAIVWGLFEIFSRRGVSNDES